MANRGSGPLPRPLPPLDSASEPWPERGAGRQDVAEQARQQDGHRGGRCLLGTLRLVLVLFLTMFSPRGSLLPRWTPSPGAAEGRAGRRRTLGAGLRGFGAKPAGGAPRLRRPRGEAGCGPHSAGRRRRREGIALPCAGPGRVYIDPCIEPGGPCSLRRDSTETHLYYVLFGSVLDINCVIFLYTF